MFDNLTKEEAKMYEEKALNNDGVAMWIDGSENGAAYFERSPYPVRVDFYDGAPSAGAVPWIGY